MSHSYPLLFCALDQQGYFTYVNMGWQQLGYETAQLFQHSYLQLLSDSQAADFKASILNLGPEEKIFNTTHILRNLEGHEVTVHWQWRCLSQSYEGMGWLDTQDSPLHIKQQLNDLQTVLEGLQEAVVINYPNLSSTAENDPWSMGQLQTLNQQAETILETTIEPADFVALWKKWESNQKNPVSYTTSRGKLCYLQLQGQVLYRTGQPFAQVLSFWEVTAHQQLLASFKILQHRLDFLWQNQGNMWLEWNLRTSQVIYSEGWQSLLGYGSADLGQQIAAWYHRVHPADHPGLVKEIKNCLEGNSSYFEKVHRVQHKEGSYRWLRGYGQRSSNNSYFLVSFQDVSEQKRLEQLLEQSLLFEHWFKSLPVAVLVLDNHEHIVEANAMAAQLYDYPVHELRQLNGKQLLNEPFKQFPRISQYQRSKGGMLNIELYGQNWQTANQRGTVIVARDVTAFRKTNIELADREARYRLLFEALSDTILVFEASTHEIVEVNRVASELYGYSQEKLLQSHLEDILFDPAKSVTLLRAASRKKLRAVQDWHRHADGHQFPVEISTGYYSFKEKIWICAIVREISERLQKEASLRQASVFANALIQTSPAFFITITPTGQITMLNDTLLKALNYKAEEVIGHNYLELLIPTSDQAIVSENLNALLSRRQEKMLSEMTILSKEGRPLLIECHCCVLPDPQGEIEYVLAVGIDQGERRETLQALQIFKTVVENSHEAIAVLGPERELLYINPAHEKLFKYSFEHAKHLRYRDYFPPQSWKRMVQEIRTHLEKEGKTWEGILEMRDRAGRILPVWARFDVVTDEAGKMLFAFSLMHDITEQQRLEKTLQEEREQYETIFQAAPLAIVYKNRNGQVVRANRYAIALRKAHQAEEQLKEDEKERAEDWAIMHSGQARLGYVERWAKGYLRVDKLPYQNKQGEILGILSFSQDVTEQMRAEQALRYEHEQYEIIFHSAPLSIIYKDKENRIIRANRYAAKWMGVPLRDLEGMSLYDLNPEHAKEYHVSDLEVITSGKPKLGLIEKQARGFSQVDKIPYRDNEGEIQGVIVFSVNITKRVKVEQALRQRQQVLQANELHLRLAIETLPTLLYVLDKDFNFILWNRECEQVTGYSAEEVVNNPQAWEFLYPDGDYRQELLNTTREMVENYAGFRDWEWTLTCKDGSQKTILWSGSSQPSTDDFSLCAVGHDITEHDQVLQLLCDNEERLRIVIENMPIMFVAYNQSGEFVMWNRHCEMVTGYKAYEMLRNPFGLDLLYPQPTYREKVKAHLQAKQFLRWQTEVFCKDGGIKTVAWSNVSHQHAIPGWFGWMVGEDLSEFMNVQQFFEQQDGLLRGILNATDVAIGVTDGRGRFLYVNTSYADLYGYQVQDLMNKRFSILVPHDESHPELRHYFRFITNPHQPYFIDTWTALHQDGHTFSIHLLAKRLEISQPLVVWTVRNCLETDKMLPPP